MVIYDDIIKMLIHICHFYFLETLALQEAEELTNCLRLQYNFRYDYFGRKLSFIKEKFHDIF